MKCLNCFNECRDDLFFCNICGAPLLSGEQTAGSSPVIKSAASAVNPVSDFSASSETGKPKTDTADQTSPVGKNNFTAGVQSNAQDANRHSVPGADAEKETDFDTTDIRMPVIPQMPKQGEYAPSRYSKSAYSDDKINIDKPSEPVPEKTKQDEAKKEKSAAQARLDLMLEKDDDRAKVLTRGKFVAMELLLYVPIINIILLILWAVNKNGNPNRRNYAVAKLICIPLLAVFFVILAVFMYATGMFDSIIASLENYLV